ncbi:MAG: hypothetical protein U0T73_11385 [Chitinophagales bacterium]
MPLKKFLSLFAISFFAAGSYAQQYDRTWIWGADPALQDSVLHHPSAGNEEGLFTDSFRYRPQYRGMAYWESNCNFSDSSGRLLFQTNGMWVMDSSGHIIENGDSLGYTDYYWEDYKEIAHDGVGGMALVYSFMALPQPGTDTGYYLFYPQLYGDVTTPDFHPVYSYITRHRSTGHLKIEKKDIRLSMHQCEIGFVSACRHGNGRDWWVFFKEWKTNCYLRYLLKPDTLAFSGSQCIGEVETEADYGKLVFSADGTKAVRGSVTYHPQLFDFDRCSGLLSHPLVIDTFPEYDTLNLPFKAFCQSAEISSNNRFVYLNLRALVYQYDLEAADVMASRDTVLNTTKLKDTFSFPQPPNFDTLHYLFPSYNFKCSQMAPDGRIFFATAMNGLGHSFTTIERPNEKGAAAMGTPKRYRTSKMVLYAPPHFPHYRTGRKIGSGCDTIYSGINSLYPLYGRAPALQLQPNPNSGGSELLISYNWIEWERYRQVQLVCYNSLGAVVLQLEVPAYSGFQQITLPNLQSGVYSVALEGDGKRMATSRLMME